MLSFSSLLFYFCYNMETKGNAGCDAKTVYEQQIPYGIITLLLLLYFFRSINFKMVFYIVV